MQRVARFEKVTFEQFAEGMKDLGNYSGEELRRIYNSIILPTRATTGSAGYDFHTPVPFTLESGQTIKFPTGIRAWMQPDWALFMFPRSGLGFKYRLQLNNTVGIIDSDYYYSDNEGQIFVKLTNDSNEGRILVAGEGDAVLQGVFLPYGITEDDDVSTSRNGGFGSTG
ncbi:MAG: deoxyuridine 5'-triphosphate nucleotidohydrolase [Lachnospiraceae bacterium]|nr:deoxyuridine 5'-triphosphate nucleotidohydrolase [Lachnospiraceae bacterium]